MILANKSTCVDGTLICIGRIQRKPRTCPLDNRAQIIEKVEGRLIWIDLKIMQSNTLLILYSNLL